MHKLVETIESTRHLVIFEAASRLGSFTKAANELNVTQPAISQSIRRLESVIGVTLFIRAHRSIRLTLAGERLAQDVSGSFARIYETVKSLSQIHHGQHVTLSVSTAFAYYWMVPRLKDFHRRYPHIDIRLQTTDKDLNLADEGLSLGVRRGLEDWPGYEAVKIAPEILYPIASPQFMHKYSGQFDNIAAMQPYLIHLEEPFRPRPSWGDWNKSFEAHYQDNGRGLRLNDYALVIQAAMAGQGIAMGWDHIVAPSMRQNLLVEIGDWRWQTGQDFYLLWAKYQPLSEHAKIVRDWICQMRGKIL